MKLADLCSIAVVLGSMTCFAQSRAHNQPAVAGVVTGSTGCPIDIDAQKNPGTGLSQPVPANSQQDQGPSQNLHLAVTNSSYAQIVGVRVTAYGLNAKGQLTPATSESEATSAIEKSFDLKLVVDPKSTGSVDLVLSGFTAVTVLNVDAIHYAGGSTWQPASQQVCHVVPDAAMLIGKR